MKIIESEHEIELKSITGQIATGKNGATFLVARDGKEIVLRDIPIDVRDGQWVTLIHLIHVRDTYPLYIYNHTTDQEYLYKRVLSEKLPEPLVSEIASQGGAIGGLICCLLLGLAQESSRYLMTPIDILYSVLGERLGLWILLCLSGYVYYWFFFLKRSEDDPTRMVLPIAILGTSLIMSFNKFMIGQINKDWVNLPTHIAFLTVTVSNIFLIPVVWFTTSLFFYIVIYIELWAFWHPKAHARWEDLNDYIRDRVRELMNEAAASLKSD